MPYKNKDIQREYQRNWIAKRRAQYLRGKNCTKCGSVNALEFHHKNPDNKITHRFWSWRKDRLEAELAKCEVLCARCHDQEHAALFNERQVQRNSRGLFVSP